MKHKEFLSSLSNDQIKQMINDVNESHDNDVEVFGCVLIWLIWSENNVGLSMCNWL